MYKEHKINIVTFKETEQFAAEVYAWSNQGEIVGPDSYGGDAPSSDL